MNTPKSPKASAKDLDADLSGEIDRYLAEAEEAAGVDPDFDLSTDAGLPAPGSKEDILKGKQELDSFDRRIFNEEQEDWELQLEAAMIDEVEALIIVGESGVGKTTLIKQLAAKFLNSPVAYFNAPTMDPFIHLVGIPEVSTNPETQEKVLSFVRKSGIEEAELLVLDEINRVTPSAQNALFELVATRMINGERFGKLKMVWGAMNPPRSDITGRTVEDVEDALVGRFMKSIPILAKPKFHHYFGRNGMGANVVHKCLRWWYQHIEAGGEKGQKFKDIITPRVLEYIMITIQNLENRKAGKGDPRHRPLTPRLWNVEFDSITHHSKLRQDTAALQLPFAELKQMFLGRELFALSSLMDNSSEIDAKIAEIQDPDNPDAAKMACSVILDGIKGTRLRPNPLIPWYRIGEFSRVLTAVPPDDANLIINGRPEIAGYLFNKCVGNDQTKREYSKNNMEHPVWKKATPGEWAIYKHLEYPITIAVKKSAGFAKPGAAPPKSGAPGAAPAAPVKKPGVP